MSEEMSLIGDDCRLYTGAAGEEKTGDGTKTLDELAGGTSGSGKGKGFWIITAKAASGSIWPNGSRVGDCFPAAGSEVPATGDKARLLTLTEIADASGWNTSISRAEVDVSKLKDEFKTYRLGKRDAQGTIRSIFTMNVTDASGGMVQKTMRSFRKAASGTVSITEIDNAPIYFLGYIRESSVPGETSDMVFAKIYLYNMTLGADTGAAQSYDTSFRLASDPTFYSIENAAS